MDSAEAKRILALYRPGDTDSPDPRMAQALKLASEDPQLAAWFGQHCAAHVKLPTEPAAALASPASPAAAERSSSVNRRAFLLAALAGLVLLSFALWWHFKPVSANSFDSYREHMARLVQRSYPMKLLSADQAQIRQYFRTGLGAVDYSLPKNLEKLPGSGAAVFTWHGETVSLLGVDAGGGTNLNLFLIKPSAFTGATPSRDPQFTRVGEVTTASWTVGNIVYLLTGPLDEATLKNFIE